MAATHTIPGGLLVVIEGIDGAGKSTVVRALAAHCAQLGLPCVTSREPTDGPWGKKLRDSASTGRLPIEDELDLFLRDRADHVERLIAPTLTRGEVVVLDRYYFSTAAYQGARGLDPEEIIRRNELFAPRPDLVLLLDYDPAGGQARIRARGDAPDEFEHLDSLQKVRGIFLSLRHPAIVRVDAARPAGEVAAVCLRHFDQRRTAKQTA